MRRFVFHNILMTGPPGAGKTLLARAVPSILPHTTFEEALDVTRIYSVADQLPIETPLVQNRPFSSPAPSPTWQEASVSSRSTWQRRCSTDRGWKRAKFTRSEQS